MELRQLRYFIAVAAELNFRKAAQGLNVTQPALSRQIRQLEEELGTDLFVRNRKMVNLTQNGRLLLPQARNLIGSAKRMRELMSRVGGGQVGSVYVGVATALSENVRRIIVEYTAASQRSMFSARTCFPLSRTKRCTDGKSMSLSCAFRSIPGTSFQKCFLKRALWRSYQKKPLGQAQKSQVEGDRRSAIAPPQARAVHSGLRRGARNVSAGRN